MRHWQLTRLRDVLDVLYHLCSWAPHRTNGLLSKSLSGVASSLSDDRPTCYGEVSWQHLTWADLRRYAKIFTKTLALRNLENSQSEPRKWVQQGSLGRTPTVRRTYQKLQPRIVVTWHGDMESGTSGIWWKQSRKVTWRTSWRRGYSERVGKVKALPNSCSIHYSKPFKHWISTPNFPKHASFYY